LSWHAPVRLLANNFRLPVNLFESYIYSFFVFLMRLAATKVRVERRKQHCVFVGQWLGRTGLERLDHM
jgi:hypothetical protein